MDEVFKNFVSRDHCGLLRVLIATILLTGVWFENFSLAILFQTSDIRCWSCPDRLLYFQALNCPCTMFLSTFWSGTQPGLTPVKCLRYFIHAIIYWYYESISLPQAIWSWRCWVNITLLGFSVQWLCPFSLPGLLSSLGRWCFLFEKLISISHTVSVQAKHVHYSILVFWWETINLLRGKKTFHHLQHLNSLQLQSSWIH